jgi:hypothetical protein
MPDRQPASIARYFDSVPFWVWVFVVLFPPLTAGVVLGIPRFARLRKSRPPTTERALDRWEYELRHALRDVVGEAERSGGEELCASLRAAGVDPPIAAHAARVRERMWQATYGPDDEADPEELTAEVREVLKALGGHAGTAAILVIAFLATITTPVTCQTAERLYEAGALMAAADSFAARTQADPWDVSHWYNLGTTWERAGENERARSAWIRAARLAPRDERIRAALDQLPPQDMVSSRQTSVSPVAPQEALVFAVFLWILAWLGIALRVRRVFTVAACLIALGFAAYGLRLVHRYSIPLAIVAAPETPLRTAPFGPAQPRQILSEGAAVRVARIDGPWMLVERGSEIGWLLSDEVITLK